MKLTLIATAAAAAVGVASAADGDPTSGQADSDNRNHLMCAASYQAYATGPCATSMTCATDPTNNCTTVCPDGCQATIDTVHADCGGYTLGEEDEGVNFDTTTQPLIAAQVATFGCRCVPRALRTKSAPTNTTHNTHTPTHHKAAHKGTRQYHVAVMPASPQPYIARLNRLTARCLRRCQIAESRAAIQFSPSTVMHACC